MTQLPFDGEDCQSEKSGHMGNLYPGPTLSIIPLSTLEIAKEIITKLAMNPPRSFMVE